MAASCDCGGALEHVKRSLSAEFYRCRRCGKLWQWRAVAVASLNSSRPQGAIDPTCVLCEFGEKHEH